MVTSCFLTIPAISAADLLLRPAAKNKVLAKAVSTAKRAPGHGHRFASEPAPGPVPPVFVGIAVIKTSLSQTQHSG